MANYNLSATVVGLGTVLTVTAPTTDRYIVDGKLRLPGIVKGSTANSAVVAVINVNGSPVYTGFAGAEGLSATIFCTVGDIITVVLSSAATVDQGLQAVKSTLTISEG